MIILRKCSFVKFFDSTERRMVRERLNVYYYGAKESKKFVVPVFGDVGILNVVMFLFPNF